MTTPPLAEVIALLPCLACGAKSHGPFGPFVADDPEVNFYGCMYAIECENIECTAMYYFDARDKADAARQYNTRASAASLRDEGDGWLPIDSAPKDGTRFLGLTSFGVEPVKWCADMGDDYGLFEGWIGTEQDSACLPANRLSRLVATCQPTHWKPLPTPPAQPAAQEKQP